MLFFIFSKWMNESLSRLFAKYAHFFIFKISYFSKFFIQIHLNLNCTCKMSIFSAKAGASELISVHRRDDEQMRRIYDRMSDCFLRLFGERLWIRYHQWMPSLTAAIYFTLTNLRARQTIGEESIGLVQIGANGHFPSLLRRLLFVLFEVFARSPLLSLLLLNSRHSLIRQIQTIAHPIGIEHIHSAWFFLFNSFYLQLSKRLSSIRYLSLRPRPNSIPRKLFQFVGFATLVQFVVVLMSNIVRLLKNALKERQSMALCEQKQSHKSGFVCKICSTQLMISQMRRPLCFPCGHSLCSDCLISLLSSRDESTDSPVECPFCRVKFPLNRIIFPLNM